MTCRNKQCRMSVEHSLESELTVDCDTLTEIVAVLTKSKCFVDYYYSMLTY